MVSKLPHPKTLESRSKVTLCSRVSDIRATCHDDAGNLDIRVPENLNRENRQRARCAQEVDALASGNPVIRVPEKLKGENGLSAGTQKERRTAKGEERDTRGKETAEETRGPPTHTSERDSRMKIGATPQRDRRVPRSLNSTTSLEGRG
ncbi:hypothetical protein NDU88_013309 [Pleurodeles waltl]|uniref:Uncharacterized protein n=1 Tax=Pleurodeles waltl TaxID=8319 RepID=A0AAV7R5U6_PLEWA|nr:hypothetical protein NDU88_013309 [Pleurodeles waltl]